MNIVFIHSVGISPTMGGISRITHTLGNAFFSIGYNVFYFGFNKERNIEYDNNQRFLDKNNPLSVINIDNFIKFTNDNKIDFVINQASTCIFVLDFLQSIFNDDRFQAKIITCYHNCIMTQAYNYAYQNEYVLKKLKLGILFYIEKNKLVNRLMTIVYKWKKRSLYSKSFSFSDAIVFLNQGQKNEYMEMCAINDSPKFHILPNCVNKIETREYYKQNIVLWVGQFDNRIKRPDLMIKIWSNISSKVPDWRLVMIGDGTDFSEMESLVFKLHIPNIELVGRAESYPYYEKSKIVCVTSVHESFSMVTVEAMIHRCPVILFDSFPMARELIKDKQNGRLIKAFDLKAYEAALIGLMTDDKQLLEYSNKAFSTAFLYDTENICKEWIAKLNYIKDVVPKK